MYSLNETMGVGVQIHTVWYYVKYCFANIFFNLIDEWQLKSYNHYIAVF